MSDATNKPSTPDEPNQYSSSSPPPPPPPGGGSYQPAQPSQQTGASRGTGQPADLGYRLLARLIDFILLAVVLAIINSVLLAAMFAGTSGDAFGFGAGASFGYAAVSAIITAAVYLGYFAFMESSRGQTIGKMALKLETRGPTGGKPTMEQALRRNAWTALGLLAIIPVVGWFLAPLIELAVVIVILVTINNSPARQGWHDNFAGGTSVVKAR